MTTKDTESASTKAVQALRRARFPFSPAEARHVRREAAKELFKDLLNAVDDAGFSVVPSRESPEIPRETVPTNQDGESRATIESGNSPQLYLILRGDEIRVLRSPEDESPRVPLDFDFGTGTFTSPHSHGSALEANANAISSLLKPPSRSE